jgi:hypothetical protein
LVRYNQNSPISRFGVLKVDSEVGVSEEGADKHAGGLDLGRGVVKVVEIIEVVRDFETSLGDINRNGETLCH